MRLIDVSLYKLTGSFTGSGHREITAERSIRIMKPLRYGMVGGGPGAFIGDAHRRAISLDSSAKLTAGCFSRDEDKCLQQGRQRHGACLRRNRGLRLYKENQFLPLGCRL